jgi:pseudaminic acid synthase
MYIGQRKIGQDTSPFIIAEMSGNHNQSLERALKIVDAAADSGAHAIKLQTFTADTITIKSERPGFQIDDKASPWKGNNLHDLYKRAHTPWEWHFEIMSRAQKRGLICFSSPFDETAVDFLESLGVPAYKIASFESVHLPLVRKAASTGKPLIVSTGMSSLVEIGEMVGVARESGCKDLVLLKCTSTYPAFPLGSNLKTMCNMRETFGCEVGLSDHTAGIGVAVASVALGATVIEKHFTLRRADGGVDADFSIEPEELKALTVESERAWQSLGGVRYGPSESELKSLVFRRSLYVVKDIAVGEAFTTENLKIIRPGFGLAPKFYEPILGMRVTRAIEAGSPASWDMVK